MKPRVTLCGTLAEILASFEALRPLVNPTDTLLVRDDGTILRLVTPFVPLANVPISKDQTL